jgi:hypothetical protein
MVEIVVDHQHPAPLRLQWSQHREETASSMPAWGRRLSGSVTKKELRTLRAELEPTASKARN